MDFARKTAHTFIFRGLSLAIGAVTSIILARSLQPAQFGVFTLIITMPTTASILLSMGIHSSNIYFISRNRENAGRYIANTFYFVAASSALVAIAWALGLDKALGYYREDIGPDELFFVILLYPLIAFNIYTPSILRGLYKIAEFNIVTFLTSALKLALFSIFLLALGMRLNGALISILILYLLVDAALLRFIVKNATPSRRFSGEKFKESLSYGWRAYIGESASVLRENVVVLIVGKFLPLADIGFLALSKNLAALVIMPVKSAIVPLLPRISSENIAAAAQMTCRVIRISILVSMLVAMAALAFAGFMIPLLYGTRFVGAVLVFYIIMPGYVVQSVTEIIVAYMMGTGRPMARAYVYFFSFFVTVSLIGAAALWGLSAISVAVAMTTASLITFLSAVLAFLMMSEGVAVSDMFVPTREDFEYIKKAFKQRKDDNARVVESSALDARIE